MSNEKEQQDKARELNEKELQQAQGGVLIALLVPAVQKVRDASARTNDAYKGGIYVSAGDLDG